MDYKLAALCELPATRCTREWFFACMNAHVLHQMRIAYESLVTQCTDKRPLPSVLFEMLRQMSGLLVALGTLQSSTNNLISPPLKQSRYYQKYHIM